MNKEETYQSLTEQNIPYEKTEPLSFASAEDLFASMGLLPGSVTPLGILNDTEHRVRFYLDSEFAGNKIGVHPNDNTATVWMQADDLMKLIQNHGNEAVFTKV